MRARKGSAKTAARSPESNRLILPVALMVAREGLEPSKPLGRQIYSLLRLTASLPRQLSVVWKRDALTLTVTRILTAASVDGAGEGIRTPDRLITNQLLYRTELRQPRQKSSCSTAHATGAS